MKMKSFHNKSGYALVVTSGVMAVLAIAFTVAVSQGMQSSHTAKRMKNNIKATAYAEAGVEFAYSLLADDYDNRNNPSLFRIDTSGSWNSGDPLESTYGDGAFILTLNSSTNGQYVIINSLGKCGDSSIDVEVLVEDVNFTQTTPTTPPPNYDDYDVFKKAMATEGSAVFAGGGDLEASSTEVIIHSNGELNIKGNIDVPCSVTCSSKMSINNNTVIDGSVTAPVLSYKAKKVTISGGATEADVPSITMPTIDMEPYRLHAIQNGAYIEGSTSLSADPPGGVWYVNGSVTVPPSATINGTIIATGNITVKGDVIETHGIAVGTLGGNITYNSQATSVGMVYTQSGEFSQTGGGSSGVITGQIMAGGGAFKAGGGDLIFGVYLPVIPEDGVDDPESNGANPQIAAWQK